ncbi:FAD-dependent oxidoreductase [Rhodococcus sp. USK13]|uniref:NAD(P)/FAD-dependent oxidoreductase n=1 Tax=Rhodococcus sp. USK13 TaxID=2806442 RepID=UPI001BCCD607|nr:FAD-dependent oxidoreductase [Rhodococcus sp. USK13]
MTAVAERRNIVIVGGSIAAVTAAQVLRAEGYGGELTMLSAEMQLPYSRVPLSKAVLSGSADQASCALPMSTDDIDVRLGQEVVGLDDQAYTLHVADGGTIPFDGLIVASGARARRLSQPGQSGEYVVRDAADIPALAERLSTARTVAVVGAGFLGMEIASTCSKLGLDVTVIDRDPPLRRLLGAWLSAVVVAEAESAGVRFVRAVDGVRILGDGEVLGVGYGDTELRAEVVISAVGDIPNTEWLAGSSFHTRGPVIVDENCFAITDVVAAGDVAAVRQPTGEITRLPHWNNAVRQARTAALSLMHGRDAPIATPDHYFWTEAFGKQIKVCGRIPDNDTPFIVDHDDATGAYLLQWSTADGRPVAAATINRKMPVVKLRRMAADGVVTAS